MIKKLFMWERDEFNTFSNTLSDEYYKQEIEKKEKNLQLFHRVVGDNPLKHIDWIIEHGFEEFNKWYKRYEDGSIEKKQLLNNYEPSFFGLVSGYAKESKEERESDDLFRQSLNTRDYRLCSPANLIKKDVSEKEYYTIETTFRGGYGNRVLSQHIRYEYR